MTNVLSRTFSQHTEMVAIIYDVTSKIISRAEVSTERNLVPANDEEMAIGKSYFQYGELLPERRDRNLSFARTNKLNLANFGNYSFTLNLVDGNLPSHRNYAGYLDENSVIQWFQSYHVISTLLKK